MSVKKQVDNCSYLELSQKTGEEFMYYKKLGLLIKPNNAGLPDILEWNFGKVKELQLMFMQDVNYETLPKMLAFVFDQKVEVYWEERWHKVFAIYNHLTKEMQKINEKESVLAYEADSDEEEAGIARIQKFGAFATIDNLADGNVLLYDEIEAKPYSLIFAKLYLEREKAAYIEKLRAIKMRKK